MSHCGLSIRHLMTEPCKWEANHIEVRWIQIQALMQTKLIGSTMPILSTCKALTPFD